VQEPTVTTGGATPGLDPSAEISHDELQLAARNHGMPLEALRNEVTPLGLHYLLIHYDIPAIDPATWRLEVGGEVERPLSLSLDDLRGRPSETRAVTMECAGNGRARLSPRPISQPWLVEAVGTAEWTGTPLAPVLQEAGLSEDALEVVFTGLDRGVEGGVEQRYARSLTVKDALADDVLLAYGIGSEPLPAQHGFPLRLVVPGWYGMTNVKWLGRIDVVAEPFTGYQQAEGYRLKSSAEDPGEPVTRMMPRALMIPPGVPDFMTRERFVPSDGCVLEGRAWSGWAPIDRVEVSVDSGARWEPAELGPEPSQHAWRWWSYRWHPTEQGTHELACRARDAAGNEQPLTQPWNLKGYANNEVQRLTVHVRRPGDVGAGAA
jgi:DMSO/TMAO reductase YedYZ molybdopterin-dependent catalytic subunit